MAAQDHTVVLDSMSVDSCSPWEVGRPKVSSFQIHNLVYLEVHSGAVESKGQNNRKMELCTCAFTANML